MRIGCDELLGKPPTHFNVQVPGAACREGMMPSRPNAEAHLVRRESRRLRANHKKKKKTTALFEYTAQFSRPVRSGFCAAKSGPYGFFLIAPERG